ncbi:hypothetical protein EMGBS15_13200 [Filimonas sp.]|jgi:hypothetical protein|nr:hypothetical protein EMGBS15_13200 [Filimonas sp.]
MKLCITLCFLFFISFTLSAQQKDDIIGNWKNGEGTGVINIYKTTSGHYAGKIVWLKEPIDPETGKPKLDKRNPDETKRTVPTLGLINMSGFTFNEEEKLWENGEIYDPKTGKEYSCKVNLKDKNTIEVRGFVGISLFGRTDTWTRQVRK